MPAAPFRIVRCYFRLPPSPGGMEAHIARLSAAQRAQGIEVINVYNTGEGEHQSVRVCPTVNLGRIAPSLLRNVLFYAGVMSAARGLRGEVPTVLHVHGDWSDFLFAKGVARRIGAVATVASVHSVLTRSDAIYRAALSNYDLIFATGRAEQERLERILRRPVQHLPSAPLDLFFEVATDPAVPRCDVIAIASFVPRKRLDLVLDCAARLRNMSFCIFGDGPTKPEMEARIARMGLTNVRLEGRRPPQVLARALAGARVFLSTSEEEGAPTSALEAMAVGVPVVLTPANDYSWLIDEGRAGYVTPGWAVDEIVAGLIAVLADEAVRTRLGAAARACAAGHRWSAKADRVTGLIRALMPTDVTAA